MVHTRAKVTIDSLSEVVCEKSIGTKMNGLVKLVIPIHLERNISKNCAATITNY